jgi:hypothetical protein
VLANNFLGYFQSNLGYLFTLGYFQSNEEEVPSPEDLLDLVYFRNASGRLSVHALQMPSFCHRQMPIHVSKSFIPFLCGCDPDS